MCVERLWGSRRLHDRGDIESGLGKKRSRILIEGHVQERHYKQRAKDRSCGGMRERTSPGVGGPPQGQQGREMRLER